LKNNAIIFTINTSGYGSPQFLHIATVLKNSLNVDCLMYEPFEDGRKFFEIKGYTRLLLVSKFDKYLARFKTIITSYFSRKIVVVGHEEPLFSLLSSKTIVVYYYLEMHDDMRQEVQNANSFKNLLKSKLLSLFYKKIRYIIAPQEDRLNVALSKFKDKKGLVVLNCPLKDEVTNTIDKKDNINILYQGQINSVSQADKLLELIEKTKENITWHIAGPVAEEFKEKINDLSKYDNINYYGFLTAKELSKVRNKCNIGLVTWGDEPSLTYKYAAPNKLFEYISGGMYILSFSNYSIKKWNKEFNFGYVSENCENDVNSIVLKLDELVKNNDIIQKQSLYNMNLYLDKLNFEYQASKLIEAIKKDIEKQ